MVAALDHKGFFPKNSLSYIANPQEPFSLEYLVGVLNSPLMNAWFASQFYSFHITVTQVRQIPIALATPELRARVSALASALALSNSGRSAEEKLLAELSRSVIECYFPEEIAGCLYSLLRAC